MASEKDSGRDIKLTISISVALVVILLGGGYLFWSWFVTPPPAESRIDLTHVTSTRNRTASESAEFRQLLNQSNTAGAAEAQRKNVSFVASIPFQKEPIAPEADPKPAAKPASATASAEKRRQNSSQNQAETADQAALRKDMLAKLIKRFEESNVRDRTQGLGIAQPLGGAGTGAGSGFQGWSESIPGGYRAKGSPGDQLAGRDTSTPAPIEIIPPYWRGPGVIDIGIDSDNSMTPVIGRINTGPYAGAILEVPDGAKLQGDGVVIHFQRMSYRGKNYNVNAYALEENSLMANVASEVNNRYMSRIVLPAVLNGLGGISQLYAQANSQVVSNGFTTETVRPGMPDGAAVAGVIAGGTAGQAARALASDAARVPAKQVLVHQSKVVAIQFFGGVYNTDAIAPGRGGEQVKAAVPAQPKVPDPAQPTSELPASIDEWRQQTNQRIQEQRALLGP